MDAYLNRQQSAQRRELTISLFSIFYKLETITKQTIHTNNNYKYLYMNHAYLHVTRSSTKWQEP